MRRLFNLVRNILLPIKIAIRYDPRMVKIIQSNINAAFYFEFLDVGHYVYLIGHANNSTVVKVHDVISQLYHRKFNNCKNKFLKLLYYFELKRLINWEQNSLKYYAKIITLSKKDALILQANGLNSKNIVIEIPEVDNSFYSLNRNSIENKSLLFVGAMNRGENIDGVLWFCNEILPLIQNNIECKFYIVGAYPNDAILDLGKKNDKIIVTGFVEDIMEYYKKCELFVVPLREGAGVKIKVLEALACGYKVVSTSVGAEGIEHPNIIIADEPIEFANRVLSLLAHQNKI